MIIKLSLILIFIIGLNLQSFTQGNLLITPKRVVFDGNNQKAELNLMNTGTDSATYSISFRQYNMTEIGKLMLIEKPDSAQMPAEPYLRIFPRQVTLAPGEGQVIMLQCRRNSGMKTGEYRSHLWFRDEKNYEASGNEKPSLDTNQLSVSVTAIFGITIPIIIRSGEINGSSYLSDLKLEIQKDTISFLKLSINRTGNISLYGNLYVEFIPTHGKPFEIGRLNSIGVYTNISKRIISIKLNNVPGIDLKTGKLKVRFTSPDDSKYVVYAEEELSITN